MKKLLHIIATCRGKESRTLKVTGSFIDAFRKGHPGWEVEEIDLFNHKLPALTVNIVNGKYTLLGGNDLSGETKKSWKEVIAHIEKFLSCDAYLISAPMWNFGIPYVLKHYIDVIIQPKYLFRYTKEGPEGLVKNKKMVVITSRGGDYSAEQSRKYDLQEPYLRAIFGLVGITDITFINAQPMDAMGAEVQQQRIKDAQALAKKAAENI